MQGELSIHIHSASWLLEKKSARKQMSYEERPSCCEMTSLQLYFYIDRYINNKKSCQPIVYCFRIIFLAIRWHWTPMSTHAILCCSQLTLQNICFELGLSQGLRSLGFYSTAQENNTHMFYSSNMSDVYYHLQIPWQHTLKYRYSLPPLLQAPHCARAESVDWMGAGCVNRVIVDYILKWLAWRCSTSVVFAYFNRM